MCRPDGRKYNGEYKNNLKHGHGVWTWPDGVMLEGQWAENLPCRHACTGSEESSRAAGCVNIFTACRQLLVMAGGLRASDAPIKSRA